MTYPSVPSSWNELSLEQLKQVWSIINTYPGTSNRMQRVFSVWLYLADMHVSARGLNLETIQWERQFTPNKTDKGAHAPSLWSRLWSKLRSSSQLSSSSPSSSSLSSSPSSPDSILADPEDLFLHLLGLHIDESVSYQGSQLNRTGCMEWLEDPLNLTMLPEEYITIHHRRFQLPAPLMSSLTYQQYGMLQQIMSGIWDVMAELDAISTATPSSATSSAGVSTPSADQSSTHLAELNARLSLLRGQFLAHILLPGKWQIIEHSDTGYQFHIQKVYSYSVLNATANEQWMAKHAPEWLFHILFQYVQSCLQYYKNDKELGILFRSSGNQTVCSPLMQEVDTLNAIMKWVGTYPSHQSIYDSNAIFILGHLKDMAKESEELKRIQSKSGRPK